MDEGNDRKKKGKRKAERNLIRDEIQMKERKE